MKNKFNISRILSSEFFKKTVTSGITREQATTVAKYLNSYKDDTLTPDDILSNKKNYVHVNHAEDQSLIVGAAQLRRKDWKRCNISNIIVNEQYRKQGYGKALLAKIEEKAGYREFKILDAFVDDSNEASKALLEKYGFTKQLVFHDAKTKQNIGTWEKEVKRPERKKKTPVLKA